MASLDGLEKRARIGYTFEVVDSQLVPLDRHVRQVNLGLIYRFAPEAFGQNSRGVA
jgi:hypothetical protein